MNIFCARCESANPEGAVECSLCGNPLAATVSKPIPLVKARRLRPWIRKNARGVVLVAVFLGLWIPFHLWFARTDDGLTPRQEAERAEAQRRQEESRAKAERRQEAKRKKRRLSVTELDADMNRAMSVGVITWLDVASNSARMDVTLWTQMTAHQKEGFMYWLSSYFEAKRGYKRVTLMSNLNDQVLATYHPFTGMKIR